MVFFQGENNAGSFAKPSPAKSRMSDVEFIYHIFGPQYVLSLPGSRVLEDWKLHHYRCLRSRRAKPFSFAFQVSVWDFPALLTFRFLKISVTSFFPISWKLTQLKDWRTSKLYLTAETEKSRKKKSTRIKIKARTAFLNFHHRKFSASDWSKRES